MPLAPRKSLGGKAPRKIPQGPHFHHFPDHAGRNYTVITSRPYQASSVPKLGIQLYCLGSIEPSPEGFGDRFIWSDPIAGAGNSRNYWPRVDVFTGLTSIDECIEHHRQEKAHRAKATKDMRQNAVLGLCEEEAQEKLLNEVRGKEPWPHIVPTWCRPEQFWHQDDLGSRYRSWILVVPADRHSWGDVVERGLLAVSFDLDVTTAMETTMEYWGIDEDSCLEGDKDGWVLVEKSGYENYEPVQTSLLCARDQPQFDFLQPDDPPEHIHEVLYGWQLPGRDRRLCDFWCDRMMVFWDCTYRLRCEACDNYETHDACGIQLDEHVLDDDAQCVACRRALEYRRRSKRIAARAKQ